MKNLNCNDPGVYIAFFFQRKVEHVFKLKIFGWNLEKKILNF